MTRPGKNICIREDVHERLAEAAEGYHWPIGTLASKLLDEALDNLIPPEQFRLTRPPIDPKAGLETERE